MIFLIDAYNIIHAVDDFAQKLDHGLKSARDYLLSVCRSYRSSRGDIEKIILVFDGSSDVGPWPESRGTGIEVVYTETGEDADDRLIEILMRAVNPCGVTVVSNDNYVTNHARAFGSCVMTAAEFYGRIKFPKKFRKTSEDLARCHKISGDIARSITEEYGRHLRLD